MRIAKSPNRCWIVGGLQPYHRRYVTPAMA